MFRVSNPIDAGRALHEWMVKTYLGAKWVLWSLLGLRVRRNGLKEPWGCSGPQNWLRGPLRGVGGPSFFAEVENMDQNVHELVTQKFVYFSIYSTDLVAIDFLTVRMDDPVSYKK